MKRAPNILLITCHDLGRHIGPYGIRTVHTPNLDRLAEEGVRMTNAFATSCGCSPSRAAMATGRYPHANGVMGLTHPPFSWDLFPDERHIAQLLGDAGYDTHLFGFQHVSPFDERPGFGHIHTDHNRGLAEPVAAKVGEMLRSRADSRPFYLEINLEEPHRPYDQGNALPDTTLGVTVPGYLLPGLEAEHEMAALQGAVRQADDAIGSMLTALDGAGLSESTCVIFVPDHGIAMPRAKCTLYDPGIEVAMIVRWPAGGTAGLVEDLISNVDLLPTLLEMAAIPVPDQAQGRSFLQALHGEPFTPREMIFAEKTYHSYYDPMRAVRTADFKYIRNFEPAPKVEIPGDIAVGEIYRANVPLYTQGQHPPEELYDLRADPLEFHNLAGRVEYDEARTWLQSCLEAWMRETGDPLIDGQVPLPGFQREEPTAGRPEACR